jgi:YfiH family protein
MKISNPSHNFRNMSVSLFLLSETKDKNIITAKLQVHGNKIVEVNTGNEDVGECDGLVTKNRNLKLGIRTADCPAICFADGEKIGIAHVGWKGLCAGIIEKMFTYFGKENTEIYVAPFLHSFEIQKDACYDLINARFSDKYFNNKEGKIIFDFHSAISSLLPNSAIFDKRDTETDLSLPSNRRDKTKERLVACVSFIEK